MERILNVNEIVERLKLFSLPSNPNTLFWTQVSDVTNQIEQLNRDDDSDPYDRLAQVQTSSRNWSVPGSLQMVAAPLRRGSLSLPSHRR